MKLGIISDTHDRLESLGKAIEIFAKERIDMLVHCGDWVSPFTLAYFDTTCKEKGLQIPVKSVLGNNEGDVKRIIEVNRTLKNPVVFCQQLTLELTIDNKKAIVFHGHDQTLLDSIIASKLYDIVLTGHTHIKRLERINGVLVINPGTTSFAANSKIISEASVAVYESATDEVRLITFR